jgi:exodeoxyribonuclease VII small subunit
MSKEQPFENALKRLEEIVKELEEGELNLDDMIKKYEEGSKLIKMCQNRLDQAEKQIKALNVDKDESINLEPFEE